MSGKKSKSKDDGKRPPEEAATEPAMEKMVSALDMSEPTANSPHNPDLHTRINSETGVLAWSELVRFFARGVVIKVAAELDLVEVGHSFATDDSQRVESWLENSLLARASDDDARDWTQREPEFWTLVAAPWVLVQEAPAKKAEPDIDQPKIH